MGAQSPDMDSRREEELIHACWLDTMRGVGRKQKIKILDYAASPKDAYSISYACIKALIGEKGEMMWKYHRNNNPPEKLWENLHKRRIKFTYINDEAYPGRLKKIKNQPFGLYYIGELPSDDVHSVAIIGARMHSHYGRYMAESFGRSFAENGINVISGMALGIDGISQRAAIHSGGKSYGVFGCGVDIVYPKANEDLYYMLIEHGGIISEYIPGTAANPRLFPPRNRIISALSDVVLVIEAKEKSGTLITVDMALEQGKEVYVVPGRCTDELSRGCNRLIRQGAGLAASPEDILEDMGWGKNIYSQIRLEQYYKESENNEVKNKEPNTKLEKTDACAEISGISQIAADILNIVRENPVNQDDIVTILRQKGNMAPIPIICQGLIELELKKIITRSTGLYTLM